MDTVRDDSWSWGWDWDKFSRSSKSKSKSKSRSESKNPGHDWFWARFAIVMFLLFVVVCFAHTTYTQWLRLRVEHVSDCDLVDSMCAFPPSSERLRRTCVEATTNCKSIVLIQALRAAANVEVGWAFNMNTWEVLAIINTIATSGVTLVFIFIGVTFMFYRYCGRAFMPSHELLPQYALLPTSAPTSARTPLRHKLA